MPIKDWSKYPDNWKSEIRPRILERDGNCCKVCKAKNGDAVFRGVLNDIEVFQDFEGNIYRTDNGEYIKCDPYEAIFPSSGNECQKAIKVVLTIAHLDHDTTNNTDENLAAMCQLHHLRYDIQQHKKNSRETMTKKRKLQSLF